jgi:hypothetical protein
MSDADEIAPEAHVEALRLRAIAAPIDFTALLPTLDKPEGLKAHYDNLSENFSLGFNDGAVITFTIEQGHPDGTFRHLTLLNAHHGPNVTMVSITNLALLLGFVGPPSDSMLLSENLPDGRTAIHVMQPLNFHPPNPRRDH